MKPIISILLLCVPYLPCEAIGDFADGEGRLCYGCLTRLRRKDSEEDQGKPGSKSGYPTFDIRNFAVTDKQKIPACQFHRKVQCPSMDAKYKCFIDVIIDKTKKGPSVTIEKGCRKAPDKITKEMKCIPEKVKLGKKVRQTCYCSKRLCNSDMLLIGGSKGLTEKVRFSRASSSNKMSPIAGCIVVAMLLLAILHETTSRQCCTGHKKLSSNCESNARCCQQAGCPKDQDCATPILPDTNCSQKVTCSGKKPICRLLYFEVAKDTAQKDQEPEMEDEHWVRQDCFDNVANDVKIGCEFFHKIFYENHRERVTYSKECFCDQDDCNENLSQICVKSKTVKSLADTKSTCTGTCGGTSVMHSSSKEILPILVGITRVLIY